MAIGFLSPDAFMRVMTSLGVVAPGAKLYTYLTGSSTPASVYTSRTLGVATANPLVADTGGLFTSFWLDPTVIYRFTLLSAAGATIAGPVDGIAVGGGPNVYTYVAKSGTYSAVAGDLVSATSGTFTVTLPLAASNPNASIAVANNGTGTITVGRTGSDTVGLATSQTLNPGSGSAEGDAMPFTSDGISNWIIL